MSDKNSQLLAALIAERKLTTETIGRVMKLYSSGKDVISYLQKDFTDAQLQEILTGLEEGCDVSFYDNTLLSPEQMKAIRVGTSRLSKSQSQLPLEGQPTPCEDIITVIERDDSSNNGEDKHITEQRTSEKAKPDVVEDEPDSPTAKIFGGIFGFVMVAALVLLPRLCSQRIEKETIDLIQDFDKRGVDLKYEPKVTTVNSGDLSLEHTVDWESTTGDAEGYGYSIDLSHNSTFVAAIEVTAFRNPNHMPLSGAVNLSINQLSALFGGVKATAEEVRDFVLYDTPSKVFNYRLAGDDNMKRRCITSVIGNYVVLVHEAFERSVNKEFDDVFGSIERSIRIKSDSQTTKDEQQSNPPTQVHSQKPGSENMTISHEEATVGVGKTITLKAYNYGSILRWESDDTDIATVSQSGVVRGKSQGSVLIWAIGDEENYLCCNVIVEPSSKNMTISQEKATVGVGKTITLKAYNYGSTLRWESDDPDIATVSQNGVVKGKSLGNVFIWAIGDEENYLCCDVFVK